VPHKRKGPVLPKWQALRLTPETAEQHFSANGTPQNIGVLTGEPSGWLVDVDLDCREAVLLAPQYLPSTLRFGRDSKPSSHWLYICPNAEAKAFSLPALPGDRPRTVVEIRATRQQTVFPPSIHPSGEQVRWESGGPNAPTVISADELKSAVLRLALASAAQMPGVSPTDTAPWTNPPPVHEAKQRDPEIDAAVQRYNADNAQDWPRSGGDCPICGHRDCFGNLDGNPDRWACFSASHTSGGIRGPHCWHGDALDLEAHRTGASRLDILRAGGYLSAPQRPPSAPVDRPLISVRAGDGHDAVYAALPYLANSAQVYKRAQRLVRVVDWDPPQQSQADDITRAPGVPVISEISGGALWVLCSEQIQWMRWDARAKAERQCDPPAKVVTAIHSLGDWPAISPLRGIVTIPILRDDGSLCASPGYDERSELYYAPTAPPPDVKESPTQVDAACAASALLEVIQDFPFIDQSHRSAWLATVLSRVGWGAFRGGAPLTVFDATAPGIGKTLAADMSAMISTGATAAHSPYVSDDDELRKRITSHLMAGDQVVLIDNVPGGGVVGWPSLDAALTSETWQDRELGTNSVARLPMDALWMATGNNLEIGADAMRRTLLCRLEAEDEKPEERTGFAHPDLPEWVRAERSRLLAAAFTMLRAYIVAGKPGLSLVPLGSFDGWSNLVRSAIVWAGQPDPCGARVTAEHGVDQDAEAHSVLLAEWGKLLDAGGAGLTCGQVLGQIRSDGETFGALAEAIMQLCESATQLPSATVLGRSLRKLRGRVRSFGGKRMRLACHKSGQATKWSVFTLADNGGRSSRSTRSSLPPTRTSCHDNQYIPELANSANSANSAPDEREPGEDDD
jgi:hypothetical protein